MGYKILVVDDDEHTHVIVESVLDDDFELIHAKNSQEAIDVLSDETINLILSDIHMPGMTGLEFLESLMTDEDKRDIPVLIMTNLPTVEKEKKALKLGAADFINKIRLVNEPESVKKQVQMKLLTKVSGKKLSPDLQEKKNTVTSKVMESAINGNFEKCGSVICQVLADQFDADYTALMTVENQNSGVISSAGKVQPKSSDSTDIRAEQGFKVLEDNRGAYLTNHIFNENIGFLQEFSEEHSLPAEIAVPLYNINERTLLMNNMKIPDSADLFGVLIIKRNKLFTTNEYELISGLMTQFGSVLWRLYSK